MSAWRSPWSWLGHSSISQGRGVIERWWQLADAFQAEVEAQEELLTIHELNCLWEAFRIRRYRAVIHSELGQTPTQAIAKVDYIKLRLTACGARKQPLFDDDAIAALFDASAGVPRRINRIATAAMIVAASRNKQLLSAQDVLDARLDRGRA